MYFEVSNISVRYDKVQALARRLARARAGRGRGADRRQRRRQDHDPARDHRPEEAGQGEIWFEGQRIDQLPPAEIVAPRHRHGARGRHVYPYMSVKDNLLMGAYLRARTRPGSRPDLERIFVRFPRVKERMSQQAGTLSGGEQEMVVVGRALMARPSCSCSTSPRSASPPWWCARSPG